MWGLGPVLAWWSSQILKMPCVCFDILHPTIVGPCKVQAPGEVSRHLTGCNYHVELCIQSIWINVFCFVLLFPFFAVCFSLIAWDALGHRRHWLSFQCLWIDPVRALIWSSQACIETPLVKSENKLVQSSRVMTHWVWWVFPLYHCKWDGALQWCTYTRTRKSPLWPHWIIII